MNTRIRKNRQRRLNDETAPLIARNHDECDCVFISLYFFKESSYFHETDSVFFPRFFISKRKKDK